MRVVDELMIVGAAGCFSVLLAVAVTVGTVWFGVVVYRHQRRRGQDRWTRLANALGLSIESQLPRGRLEGEIDGLAITVEERLVSTASKTDIAIGVAALALGGDPGLTTAPMTFVRATLRTPLSREIAYVHTDSGGPLRSPKADRDVAGHANPLADSLHRVSSADVAWAASLLGQLAERGGLADLEAGGWRISFTETTAQSECTRSADEASVREGLERIGRLVARLQPGAAYR